VFCGSWNLCIDVWNAKTYEIIQELTSTHKDAISGIVADNTGTVWASSWDGTISVFQKQLTPRSQFIEMQRREQEARSTRRAKPTKRKTVLLSTLFQKQ
jgi:hypothetical protein